ncbi:anthranilate synthase component I family protein [Gluconobacter kanchanaburiensis]|uniref:Para-aminobenzoate synthase n=1 Tax=Gluconobacter kanchanaburiensis NBRC 103587 TaxID=1307948 RepID=A0A511B3N5_9PROT|nr:anthranilate synthase component I family protein [Gluconobacter kanchanaburiensis]MBF0860773.1 anthranilate synthase component I family protein [Gluconobacter kanchanaburiensis]GBR69767.1 para-aminobenzoate synthase component I [Gluconobacter kanchanaburiensis NBRC 103587]GEK95049.1 para-aminobenzoate synthase [Gluconobacter kanchanaburiensis NBRC 103587]
MSRVSPPLTEIPWRPPEQALSALEAAPWAAFLDSGGPDTEERARWSFLCLSPDETLNWQGESLCRNGVPVAGDVWTHLRDMSASARRPPKGEGIIPFTGGMIGMVSYEAGMALENVSSRHTSPAPRLIAASFTDVLAFDRREERCWWISQTGNPAPDLTRSTVRSTRPPLHFAPEQSQDVWTDAVRSIVDFIRAGDIFQANLTMRWIADCTDNFDELAAYRTLRQTSPAPFGAYLKTPDFSLLSASVERFISLSQDGLIETRPIKGTISLGHTAEETLRNSRLLAADEKERAENLMITDLMRNDIGRVSQIGSVRVPQLSKVEQFPHVLHLVSAIQGQLRPELDAIDLLQATLPPGSVTGAPKKRAMEIIDLLEASARGAYCGSLFCIGNDGAMDSSVIIRSMARAGDTLSVGAGGGITVLSNPMREYEEMLLKVAPILNAFEA